jgi:hypothetical protein
MTKAENQTSSRFNLSRNFKAGYNPFTNTVYWSYIDYLREFVIPFYFRFLSESPSYQKLYIEYSEHSLVVFADSQVKNLTLSLNEFLEKGIDITWLHILAFILENHSDLNKLISK